MEKPTNNEEKVEKPTGEDAEAKADIVDENGNVISKNEQKRREKEAKKLKEKEEKAQKKAEEDKNKKPKEKGAEVEEEVEDPQLYFQNRSKKIQKLKENTQSDTFPFPHKWHVDLSVPQLIAKFEPQCQNKGEFIETEILQTAGRISAIRQVSAKLIFYDIISEAEKIQLMVNAKAYETEAAFEEIVSILRRGDIIGAKGCPGRTQPGEFSLKVNRLKLLTPCLHMLPLERVGIKDPDVRYRQRYLDLICNKGIREKFLVRTKVIKFIRKFLDDHGFLEVETPTLNMIPGGASAKPFLTKHNELKLQMFMRIATELYLKQLIVGGIDRVYEIGKNFRNEGMDQTHNPEFTLCEFYWAYKDVYDLMDFTEEMLSKMVLEITGGTIVTIDQEDGSKLQIDFKRPWKRIIMMEELATRLGEPMPAVLESEEAREWFDKQAVKHKVACGNPRTTARLIDKLVGHFIEPEMVNPTFLIEHPQLMSPLAKYHRSKPNVTERFELFVKGQEYANAYTELNDPFKQRELFEDQAKARDGGDDEAMPVDEEFLKAIEHALPPTGGWGLGVDRLTMLLTNSLNIQEVILFPAMKPKEHHPHNEVKEK
jgi:lysyl-tRNA synthetase class 2